VEALLGLKVVLCAPPISPAAPLLPQEDTPPMAEPIDLKDLIERVEQERIQCALQAAQGVISEAARLLTLKRTTLIEKMRKYGVGTQAA
jgi:sigma-54 specific flagellar transcriptional regulator A